SRPHLSTLSPYTTLFRSFICTFDVRDTLQVHDVNTVFTYMCFHFSSKLGTLGFLNRGKDFDVHGVHDLTAHALSHDTCTDTFTRDRKSTRLNSSHVKISY